MTVSKRYWLMKSEPNVYSIDDLQKDKETSWEGVRNYQARNFMRDDMKKGDLVFFYHSNATPPGIAGVAEVSKEGHADDSQFDETSEYFDEKSKKENPRWYLVDIRFKKKFKSFFSLDDLRGLKGLEKMLVLQRGQRLSVQPVHKDEWDVIMRSNEK